MKNEPVWTWAKAFGILFEYIGTALVILALFKGCSLLKP